MRWRRAAWMRARMRRVGVGVNPAEIAGGDGARFRAEQQH